MILDAFLPSKLEPDILFAGLSDAVAAIVDHDARPLGEIANLLERCHDLIPRWVLEQWLPLDQGPVP